MAFYPIFASTYDTGEVAGSLFTVVSISLLLSWVFCQTAAPLLCIAILPSPKPGQAPQEAAPRQVTHDEQQAHQDRHKEARNHRDLGCQQGCDGQLVDSQACRQNPGSPVFNADTSRFPD